TGHPAVDRLIPLGRAERPEHQELDRLVENRAAQQHQRAEAADAGPVRRIAGALRIDAADHVVALDTDSLELGPQAPGELMRSDHGHPDLTVGAEAIGDPRS